MDTLKLLKEGVYYTQIYVELHTKKNSTKVTLMKHKKLIIPLLLATLSTAQAASIEEKASFSLPDNPDNHSGLEHSHSHQGYQQFDFDTVDLEKFKQQEGKLYSSKEDVMKVLTGGVKNPTGKKNYGKKVCCSKA